MNLSFEFKFFAAQTGIEFYTYFTLGPMLGLKLFLSFRLTLNVGE